MRTTLDQLWKRHGEFIIIGSDLNDYDGNVSIEKGTYQVIDKDEEGYELYNIRTQEFAHTDEVDHSTEVIVLTSDTDTLLESLYDALSRQIMNLLSEGWEIYDDAPQSSMDITPFLAKLRVVKAMLDMGRENDKG